ncbi:MAG: ArsR/SmtB family transcription factor [Candidatus Bathyarchaeia archaeon]
MTLRKKSIRHMLQWLIEGSRGGVNRARIIDSLREEPKNANQLGLALDMEYRVVRHHLEVLEANGLIVSVGEKYGKMYFLSMELEENISIYEEIWSRLRKKLKNKEERVKTE